MPHDASARFVLTRRRTGRTDGAGAPAILLHDRYADLDALDALAERWVADRSVIAVRGARSQILDQFVHGYYWYLEIEPGRPELSTLGDALAQVESLLLQVAREAPGGRAVLAGEGQGGVIALLLASTWPERVRAVATLDAGLPSLPAEVGLEAPGMNGLPVLLASSTSSPVDPDAARVLGARGATVHRVQDVQDRSGALAYVARWVAALPATG
jgi:pimeloyl-ACP methyl ester carboxylesterase